MSKKIEKKYFLAGDKVRNACFTLNNYLGEDVQLLESKLYYQYLVIGEEIGESGTPHLQGYVEFAKQIRAGSLFKINKNVHWEPRRCDNGKVAADYCKKGSQTKKEWKQLGTKGPNFGKDAVVHEFGEMKAQGKRNDLNRVYDDIKDGKSLREIMDNNPVAYMKYHGGIDKIYNEYEKDRYEPPKIYWFWGKSGSGKTRTAFEMSIELGYKPYFKRTTKWWNGYDQKKHGVVIFEDFNPANFVFEEVLGMFDRYPYDAEIKGGMRKLNSPVMFITCKYKPSKFWSGSQLVEIERRLHEIRLIGDIDKEKILKENCFKSSKSNPLDDSEDDD